MKRPDQEPKRNPERPSKPSPEVPENKKVTVEEAALGEVAIVEKLSKWDEENEKDDDAN